MDFSKVIFNEAGHHMQYDESVIKRQYPAKGFGHKWKYFGAEWQNTLRQCTKCKRYQFYFYCWTANKWLDKLSNTEVFKIYKQDSRGAYITGADGKVVLDKWHTKETMTSKRGEEYASILYDFLLPLEELNKKRKKNCSAKYSAVMKLKRLFTRENANANAPA